MGCFFYGRNDWTRTSDLFVPNEAFYQAELHSVHQQAYSYHKKKIRQVIFYIFLRCYGLFMQIMLILQANGNFSME